MFSNFLKNLAKQKFPDQFIYILKTKKWADKQIFIDTNNGK